MRELAGLLLPEPPLSNDSPELLLLEGIVGPLEASRRVESGVDLFVANSLSSSTSESVPALTLPLVNEAQPSVDSSLKVIGAE